MDTADKIHRIISSVYFYNFCELFEVYRVFKKDPLSDFESYDDFVLSFRDNDRWLMGREITAAERRAQTFKHPKQGLDLLTDVILGLSEETILGEYVPYSADIRYISFSSHNFSDPLKFYEKSYEITLVGNPYVVGGIRITNGKITHYSKRLQNAIKKEINSEYEWNWSEVLPENLLKELGGIQKSMAF